MIGALFAFTAFSQDYQPRETWPFIYESFQTGNARTLDGTLVTDAPFNVAVHDGTLMYVGKDDTIMRCDMTHVYSAMLGEDPYVNVMGRMYKVLSELDCGMVLLGTEIDTEAQSKVNIGYGISTSTASSQSLALMMDGRFDTMGRKIQQTELDKFRGNVLPTRQTYYLRIGATLIPASKQEILSLPGVDKKEANAFLKQERIKWKEVPSLEKLLVFVSTQLNKQ